MPGKKVRGVLFVIAGLVLLFLGTRNFFLGFIVQSACENFSEKYPAKLSVGGFRFSGPFTVHLDSILMIPEHGDTLISIAAIEAGINPWSILLLNPSTGKFNLTAPVLKLVSKNGANNFSFLLKSDSTNTSEKRSSKHDYARSSALLLNYFFRLLPDYATIEHGHLHVIKDKEAYFFEIPLIKSGDGTISGHFSARDLKGEKNDYHLSGYLDKQAMRLGLAVSAVKKDIGFAPFVDNLQVGFDRLWFSIDSTFVSDSMTTLKGVLKAEKLQVRHPKISPEKIYINRQELNFVVSLGENWFCLDSLSRGMLNGVEVTPFIRMDTEPTRYIRASLRMDETPADTFFNSLPYGLFFITHSVRASGNLSYQMNLGVNPDDPDSVFFQSELKKKNFRLKPGCVDGILRVNGVFDHTVYEKGEPVRSFLVGFENPMFTPLSEISPFLKSSILTAEDGAFFSHRGFNEEMFAKAIGHNIRTGRFAKGASTITMQFVKNVFLSRTKTISRKLEEALIVWLIEQNRLISKERMFEAYLNIIEFGPGVYGIGEGSRFYFSKKPSELTLEESIFLASIVPKPKSFRYSFDQEGHLKPHLEAYFRLISGILLKKNIITLEQHERLSFKVDLNGPARMMVVPEAVPDSMDENEENTELFP